MKLLFLLTALFLNIATPVQAQEQTQLPSMINIKQGTLSGRDVGVVYINGDAIRTAPGFIMMAPTGRILMAQEWPTEWKNIKYTFDLYGQVWKLWLMENN